MHLTTISPTYSCWYTIYHSVVGSRCCLTWLVVQTETNCQKVLLRYKQSRSAIKVPDKTTRLEQPLQNICWLPAQPVGEREILEIREREIWPLVTVRRIRSCTFYSHTMNLSHRYSFFILCLLISCCMAVRKYIFISTHWYYQ